jgi:hypothetical protein
MVRNLAFAIGQAAILAFFPPTAILAAQAQFGTEKEAKAVLEKAVAALKENKEKALEMFNKGKAASKTAISMCSAPTPQTAFSPRIPT